MITLTSWILGACALAAPLSFEHRPPLVCAGDLCLPRLDLPSAGLDLLNDPAARTGWSHRARTLTTRELSWLRVTLIAANLDGWAVKLPAFDRQAGRVPFLIEINWATPGDHVARVTRARGALNVRPGVLGRALAAEPAARQRILAAALSIDEVDDPALPAEYVRRRVGPAVLAVAFEDVLRPALTLNDAIDDLVDRALRELRRDDPPPLDLDTSPK